LAAKQAELSGSPAPDSRLKPYACLLDEESMLASVEFELNPYALDFPTCPKGPPGSNLHGGKALPPPTTTTTRGGGRFGGAQRLAFLRHTYADEPRLLAAAEASLRRGSGTVEEVGAYEPCTDGKHQEDIQIKRRMRRKWGKCARLWHDFSSNSKVHVASKLSLRPACVFL
jgi:hypothetical protein